MADQLVERNIFAPSTSVVRVRRTLQLNATADVLGIFQHPQLGAKLLIRHDPAAQTQPRTFSAVLAGIELDADEQNATYVGTFFGLYREIPPPPPPDPPPDPPPPPPDPVFRRDVWHAFELQTNPPPLAGAEEV